MSRSTKAVTLNFLIPGAGLWYLGERQHAAINFAVAVVLTVFALWSAHEHVHYLFLAIAAGSAGYAHAAAQTLQQPPGPLCRGERHMKAEP